MSISVVPVCGKGRESLQRMEKKDYRAILPLSLPPSFSYVTFALYIYFNGVQFRYCNANLLHIRPLARPYLCLRRLFRPFALALPLEKFTLSPRIETQIARFGGMFFFLSACLWTCVCLPSIAFLRGCESRSRLGDFLSLPPNRPGLPWEKSVEKKKEGQRLGETAASIPIAAAESKLLRAKNAAHRVVRVGAQPIDQMG